MFNPAKSPLLFLALGSLIACSESTTSPEAEEAALTSASEVIQNERRTITWTPTFCGETFDAVVTLHNVQSYAQGPRGRTSLVIHGNSHGKWTSQTDGTTYQSNDQFFRRINTGPDFNPPYQDIWSEKITVKGHGRTIIEYRLRMNYVVTPDGTVVVVKSAEENNTCL